MFGKTYIYMFGIFVYFILFKVHLSTIQPYSLFICTYPSYLEKTHCVGLIMNVGDKLKD